MRLQVGICELTLFNLAKNNKAEKFLALRIIFWSEKFDRLRIFLTKYSPEKFYINFHTNPISDQFVVNFIKKWDIRLAIYYCDMEGMANYKIEKEIE